MKFNLLKYTFIACSLFMADNALYARPTNDGSLYEIRVVDENNQPIEGVLVNGKDLLFYTDHAGKCYIQNAKEVKSIQLTVPGYYGKTVLLDELKNGIIVLTDVRENGPEDILVDNGFYKKSKESTLATTSVLNIAARMHYDNAQNVLDHINGLIDGMLVGNNVRGLGQPLYVVDGVPGRDVNMLNAEEIEDVTFLSDATAVAIYGSSGVNGVVSIKTKRGRIHKNEITVRSDYGMALPKSFPDYLNAADYMNLYNEARANDGLDPLYTQNVINETIARTNLYKNPDINFYSPDYLRPFAHRANVTLQFRGGNEGLQYYVSMRYGHNGTLEKINPNNDKGRNEYDVRANLDLKINSWIKSTVDVNLLVAQDKNAFADILGSSKSFRPNLYAPLIPVEYLSEDLLNSERMKSVKLYNGYILGGSSSYKDINPVAQIFGRGYSKAVDRKTQVTNTIDFDLGMITKGLYARTRLGFDYYDMYSVNFENKFNFYEPVWMCDTVIDLIALGSPDTKADQETVGMRDFLFRYGGNVQLGYNSIFNHAHTINAVVVGYSYSEKVRDVKQTSVDTHLGFDFSYDYKNRCFVDFSGAVMNSPKLAPGHRTAFSPAVSLGYVPTNDSFMKNVSCLDYFRIRASYANLASDTDIDRYYLYQDIVVQRAEAWPSDDGSMTMYKSRYINGANPLLNPLRKQDITVGFDARLWKSLSLSATIFNVKRSDFVKRNNITYPDFYGDFTPYYNNGTDAYHGIEASVRYLKRFGDFSLDAGARFSYTTGTIQNVDELPIEYDYLSIKGQKKGALRGLTAQGLYQVSDFTPTGELAKGLPVPSFGNVQPGDVKYEDINNDGIISHLDEKVISCAHSPYSLSVDFLMKYGNFSLYVLGRGVFGGDNFLNHPSYYWVDGNDKYSSIVNGRWTPETAETATYPRLTTQSSANNFRNSTFWLYDKSYFDLSRVQLTYSFPRCLCSKIGFNSIDFNLTGLNLLKIAPERKILELGIDNPTFRTVMFGIRFGL